MVFSTMSELCSEFDSSREHGSSRASARCIECAVHGAVVAEGVSQRCRDAPVGAPAENLPRETHDPESAAPRRATCRPVALEVAARRRLASQFQRPVSYASYSSSLTREIRPFRGGSLPLSGARAGLVRSEHSDGSVGKPRPSVSIVEIFTTHHPIDVCVFRADFFPQLFLIFRCCSRPRPDCTCRSGRFSQQLRCSELSQAHST
jgi:hypothetical protein